MNRALLIMVLTAAPTAACSSREERAREAAEFRESRDALLTTDVVRSLQPTTVAGRLIYDPPVKLARDSVVGAGSSRPRP